MSKSNKYDLYKCFYGACINNDLDIVILMIEKGANNFNEGLRVACIKGHLDLAKLMIEKGARNFNWGLYYACQSGHLEIVKLLIEKGANDVNGGLRHACESGHLEIAKLMCDSGATDFNDGLACACENNQLGSIKLMCEYGADDLTCITREQCVQLLNMGVNMNRHKDIAKLKENRESRINEVKDHFNQLSYRDWDHNIITPLIYDYIPYE